MTYTVDSTEALRRLAAVFLLAPEHVGVSLTACRGGVAGA